MLFDLESSKKDVDNARTKNETAEEKETAEKNETEIAEKNETAEENEPCTQVARLKTASPVLTGICGKMSI